MHTINVLTIGSKNFNTSLEELKDYLNFKLTCSFDDLENNSSKDYDILLIHEEYFKNNPLAKKFLNQRKEIKIYVFSSTNAPLNIFDEKIPLPTCLKDLNEIIENSLVKKHFNNNSSIKIKSYLLNKNEKKLIKDNVYISLTEKEIQLLQLFLKNYKSISKGKILKEVWKYNVEADTHTVETHIYRLRKKIKTKFLDESFILNTKTGYSI